MSPTVFCLEEFRLHGSHFSSCTGYCLQIKLLVASLPTLHRQLGRIGVLGNFPIQGTPNLQVCDWNIKSPSIHPLPHDFRLTSIHLDYSNDNFNLTVIKWILSLPSSLSSHPPSPRIRPLTRLSLPTKRRMVEMAATRTVLLHEYHVSTLLLKSHSIWDMIIRSTNTLCRLLHDQSRDSTRFDINYWDGSMAECASV